ncbi:MAG: hypothetical protein WC808_00575 [Patescibacteria group bacterium]
MRHIESRENREAIRGRYQGHQVSISCFARTPGQNCLIIDRLPMPIEINGEFTDPIAPT